MVECFEGNVMMGFRGFEVGEKGGVRIVYWCKVCGGNGIFRFVGMWCVGGLG